jgi:branched-chain amino acid transport system substrate-binding protein
VLLAITASACSSATPSSGRDAGSGARTGGGTPQVEPSEILVGLIGTLSGSEAAFGLSTQDGVQLAVNEINANGGIKGKRIRVVVADDHANPEEAAASAERLIAKDQAVILLGEVASTRSLAMAAVAEEKRVPMISHASTALKLTEGKAYVFRVCFTDSFQGYAMAKFARERLKLGKVAVLEDARSDYSLGLAQAFAEHFARLGGSVVKEESYSSGDKDSRAQLLSIQTARPEAIYLPGYYADVRLISQQARSLGLRMPLLGGDGWSVEMLSQAGKALEGSYFTDHYSTQDPSPRIQRFVANFQAAYAGREPGSLAALGYDAMKLAANALARAKGLSGPELRDAIAETREFEGVTGTLTIDREHNASKPAVILKVMSGKAVYRTAIPAEAERR